MCLHPPEICLFAFFFKERTLGILCCPKRVKAQDEVDILGDAGNADGTCDGISARS